MYHTSSLVFFPLAIAPRSRSEIEVKDQTSLIFQATVSSLLKKFYWNFIHI